MSYDPIYTILHSKKGRQNATSDCLNRRRAQSVRRTVKFLRGYRPGSHIYDTARPLALSVSPCLIERQPRSAASQSPRLKPLPKPSSLVMRCDSCKYSEYSTRLLHSDTLAAPLLPSNLPSKLPSLGSSHPRTQTLFSPPPLLSGMLCVYLTSSPSSR